LISNFGFWIPQSLPAADRRIPHSEINKMHSFEHVSPATQSAALRLLSTPQTEAIAGGTDLLGELKRKIRQPKRLVNLKLIPELNEIYFKKTLSLGALVTLSEIEHHPAILKRFSILGQAASLAATPQLRNMGTLAGNLCQHPRCWYYRNPLFNCWLKGGEKCFAFNGENKYHAILGSEICHAVHPSDLAPALIALDGHVQVAGLQRRHQISLEEIYEIPKKDRRQMTVLKRNELITKVLVPAPSRKSRTIFLKAMERQAWSFALVSVAVRLSFDGDRIEEARLVLGGVAPIPWRAREAEEVLEGEKFSEPVIKSAGEAAVAKARPLRDNEYKVQLVKGLIGQALRAVWTK
jgi:xanthine dehydrogenase YagS FAD-binding subunit